MPNGLDLIEPLWHEITGSWDEGHDHIPLRWTLDKGDNTIIGDVAGLPG